MLHHEDEEPPRRVPQLEPPAAAGDPEAGDALGSDEAQPLELRGIGERGARVAHGDARLRVDDLAEDVLAVAEPDLGDDELLPRRALDVEHVRREPVGAHDDAELSLGRREDLELALGVVELHPVHGEARHRQPLLAQHLAAQLARRQRHDDGGAGGGGDGEREGDERGQHGEPLFLLLPGRCCKRRALPFLRSAAARRGVSHGPGSGQPRRGARVVSVRAGPLEALAQLAEHRPFKPVVPGSIPGRLMTFPFREGTAGGRRRTPPPRWARGGPARRAPRTTRPPRASRAGPHKPKGQVALSRASPKMPRHP